MILTNQAPNHSKGPFPNPTISQAQVAPGPQSRSPLLLALNPQPGPPPFDPLVIQVTFLNKVNRVTLDPRATPQAVHVMRMLVHYYSIRLELIKSTHLIDLEEYDVVELDAPLVNGRSYYLGFSRYDKPSLVASRRVGEGVDAVTAWNGRKLFSREGREYQIKAQKCFDAGVVTELKICRNTPNRLGFTCPFSHCGRLFHKSCDLIVHFHVEVSRALQKTGNRPFFCKVCGRSFRRKVLLNHHMREGPCRRASDAQHDISTHPFSFSKNQGYLSCSQDQAYNMSSVLKRAPSSFQVFSTAPGSPSFSNPSYPNGLTSKLQSYLACTEKGSPSMPFLQQLKLIIALAKQNPVLLTLIRAIQIKRNGSIMPQMSLTASPREICHELMVTSLLLNL